MSHEIIKSTEVNGPITVIRKEILFDEKTATINLTVRKRSQPEPFTKSITSKQK